MDFLVEQGLQAVKARVNALIAHEASCSGGHSTGVRPPLSFKIKEFTGEKGDNLYVWLREVETAFDTANMTADHLQVGHALTHLTGKARAWAFTCSESVTDVFPTWKVLKQKLMDMYATPDLVFQNQLAFLRCRQGTKDLEVYIQELKTLLAGMYAKAYSDDVSIPVFMGGLREEPARSELSDADPNPWRRQLRGRALSHVAVAWAAEMLPVWKHGSSEEQMSEKSPARHSLQGTEGGKKNLVQAVSKRRIPVGAGRPTGGPLSAVKPQGKGRQHKSPREAVLSSTDLVYHPGLMVVLADVKGFDKPWRVLIDSGASDNYVRRDSVEKSRLYAEALEARSRDVVTVRLATGVQVSVPKVSIDLKLKFSDFKSL
ncbi:hypothetical protein PsorP6_002838 [Peronosclerospora sorghi]|uniref:Uncharacterized protein n=1 Tax=Peronosclerospora sorghi TaxID=230839 RepID=A0ACC0VM53_9STRA|nr:hypothetical protein PsorP6_002838 [Peronosclerospora sorghi]